MKIGFDAKRAFNNNTGLGNYSRTLIKNLVAYFPENEYFLYTPYVKDNFQSFKPEHTFIKQPKNGLNKTFPALWRSFGITSDFKKDKIDLYHGLSHELPFNIKKNNIKSIVTIHDLIFLRYPELYNTIDRKIYGLKYRNSCNAADKIIAISSQTKQDIIDYFEISPDKIEVIYQSCDEIFSVELSEEKKQTVLEKFDIKSPYILYVGSLTARKNVLILVKAFEKLNHENLQLVIAGDGKKYKKEIENYILNNKLNHKVKILTGVAKNELPALYQSAGIFVYPSLFEGFGIPIIEALWSKTPVITSTGSCFKEAGGTSAIYTDPLNVEALANAISKVLNNSGLASEMSIAGYDYVQQFSGEKTALQLIKVYNDLMTSDR